MRKFIITVCAAALCTAWFPSNNSMAMSSPPSGLACPTKYPGAASDYAKISGKVLEKHLKEYPRPHGSTTSVGVYLFVRMMATFEDSELAGMPREIYVRSTEIMSREKMEALPFLPEEGKYYILCVRPALKSKELTPDTKDFRTDNLQQIHEINL